MKNILVVERHPVMNAATCEMIKNFLVRVRLTQADSFEKALQAADSNLFDLVIMDIGISEENSLQAITQFRAIYPTTRLLIFSSCEESIYALSSVKAGANGFLHKKASEDEFRLALRMVLFTGFISATIQGILCSIHTSDHRTLLRTRLICSRSANEKSCNYSAHARASLKLQPF